MTPQEYYNQIDIILDIIKRCTTWDQLQVLSKQHGHINQIRYAINERACEIAEGLYHGRSSLRNQPPRGV